jgi:redox-sensitive bicupin YhaK (pirin superfamily)
MSVEIRRGSDRFVDRGPGRRTAHAFSFGSHYDADHVSFGPMVCHDDHLLGNGQGFATHSHSDLVIVSYVVSGALTHTDATGSVTLRPGEVGVFRTGPSAEHSETASAPQTRFVQVWLSDPEPAGTSYDVVSPPFSPLPGTGFSAVRLEAGGTYTTPVAPRVHVFVARGALLRSSLAEPLHEGDAFLFTDEPVFPLTAGVETDLLVWTFAAEAATPHARTDSAPGSTSTTAG